MGNYILKRTLLIIPTMFLVSIIVFLLQRFIPGSAVDVIEAQFIAMGQTDIDRAAIIHQLGLDVPILQQYINWIGALSPAAILALPCCKTSLSSTLSPAGSAPLWSWAL